MKYCTEKMQTGRLWMVEFIKYAVVGGVAFAADFGTMVLFQECFFARFAWGVYIAVVLGFVVGLVVNYTLSLWFVFTRDRYADRGRSVGSFLAFGVIGAMGLAWTELGMWLGVHVLSLNYMLVKVFVTAAVLAWSPLPDSIDSCAYFTRPERNAVLKAFEWYFRMMVHSRLGAIAMTPGGYLLLVALAFCCGVRRGGARICVLAIPLLCYQFGTMLLLTGKDYRFFYITVLCGAAVCLPIFSQARNQDPEIVNRAIAHFWRAWPRPPQSHKK